MYGGDGKEKSETARFHCDVKLLEDGEATVTEQHIRMKSTANVRSGPGSEYEKVGTAEAGMTFTVKGYGYAQNGNTWYKIEINGKEGYVAEGMTNPAD